MSRIRILPENVANKIAAGEVVERPASVVKELVENALDAGARSIKVEVESGGKRMIRITDDGCGMNHDDALLAFERHATSKLRNTDDLLSIATLGFRGEALPSIAAVSRLLLETRAAEDEQGTRVEFAGGKLIGVKPAGFPVGTTISVADLFYSVPARRKFLKSETTELGHIASLVTHYALAHPERQFILKTPTQEILNAPPVERMAERVYQIFGRQSLEELVEIPVSEGPMRATMAEPEMEPGEESAKIRVTGFASRPEVQRTNRNGIYVFVNKRLVRDRLILHAIADAYRNITPPGVFPAVLLFIDLPYEEVDVNVHPAKIEVRFRHPQFVHDFTRDAVRHALSNARAVPAYPVGRVAAGGNGSGDISGIPAEQARAAAAGVGVGEPIGPPRAVIPPFESIAAQGATPGATPGSYDGFELNGDPLRPIPQRLQFGSDNALEFPIEAAAAGASAAAATAAAPAMAPAPATLPRPEDIADLKPLGQVNNSFIVAVNSEGLWIIDQHVAHERVLFEQHLRARREGEMGGQRMLVPMILELSPRQVAIFEQIGEELRANGFEANLMGAREVAIQAAPAGIAASDADKLLEEIIEGIARENSAISIDSLQAKIAASTACHAAIKVNMPLDRTKMEWLLGELSRTEYPMSCPHGRPVVLRYSTRDIERAFKRI
jgi:DNA mismatch repair protein MutL